MGGSLRRHPASAAETSVLLRASDVARREPGRRGAVALLARADERLFRHVVQRRTAAADHALWSISRAADRSGLWLAIAAFLATRCGRAGRRAAVRGLVAIALASPLANGPLKHTWRRRRPVVVLHQAPRGILVSPTSHSFPSGHAASAAAFATAVRPELPRAGAFGVCSLALAVAYSRVHTGVHYPGDVLGGVIVGWAVGAAAGRALDAALSGGTAGTEPGIPRRAVLVTNPHAGRARRLHAARRAMATAGVQVVAEVRVDEAERIDEWVVRAGDEELLVVAAGGDGTVGTTADRVAGTRAVLGVLPLGTSNDFARSLGIPVDPAKAARLLRDGTVATIDTGRLLEPGRPPRHFVHAAAIGLNASFATLASKASLRRRFGRLAYALAAAAALRKRDSFACELRYDTRVERLELVHLALINTPVFGGLLGMRVRGVGLDDRALDVIAVERLPGRRLLLAAAARMARVRRPVPGIRILQVRALHVRADRELHVTLDGELVGRLPADFDVAERALRVVTPGRASHRGT